MHIGTDTLEERGHAGQIASAAAFPFLSGFLGLACLRVWLQVCLYGSYAFSDAGTVTIVSNFSYSAVLIVGTLAALRLHREGARLKFVPLAGFVLMTLAASGLFVVQCGLATDALLPLSALAGIAAAFGGGTWANAYRRLPTAQLVVYGFLSLGLGSAAGFLLSFLHKATQLCVAVFMPACSLLCYRSAMAQADAWQDETPERWFDGEPVLTPAVLLGGVALLAFALGFARSYVNGGPVEMTAGMRAVHQIGVVAISAAFVVATLKRRGKAPSAALLWGLDIAAIALGILLASSQPLDEAGFGVALANLGDTFSLGVLFVLACDYARHSSASELTVVGLAWFCRIFFRNVGRVIAPLAGMAAGDAVLLAGIVTLALSGAMAALLSGVVPKHNALLKGETSLPKDAVGAAGSASPVARAAAGPDIPAVEATATDPVAAREKVLMATFGLTEREAQVCALIASGRNKTAIGQYLGLSENTVRTHSKSAYAKLGVHSKEELVELLEQGR